MREKCIWLSKNELLFGSIICQVLWDVETHLQCESGSKTRKVLMKNQNNSAIIFT